MYGTYTLPDTNQSSPPLRYKANVACDLITVWTFTEVEKVTSFRSASLSDIFIKLMDKILEAESTLVTPWEGLGEKDRRKSRVMGGAGDKHTSELSVDGRTLSKQEARRLSKQIRKREVIDYLCSLPLTQRHCTCTLSCGIFWASVQFDGYMIIVLYKYDTFRGGRVLQNVHNEQVHGYYNYGSPCVKFTCKYTVHNVVYH